MFQHNIKIELNGTVILSGSYTTVWVQCMFEMTCSLLKHSDCHLNGVFSFYYLFVGVRVCWGYGFGLRFISSASGSFSMHYSKHSQSRRVCFCSL